MKHIKINFDDWDEINDIFIHPNNKLYDKFIDFLNENNAYNKFINNIKKNTLCNNYKKYFTKVLPNNWVYQSFNWEKTKDGEIYWSRLHIKWRNEIIKINK